MYLPYLLWRYAAAPALHSDLLFIIDELDKSYNRSVRLVQHMKKVQQASAEPEQLGRRGRLKGSQSKEGGR